jgi:hypothetical protein
MNEAESRPPEKVCEVEDCNAWKQGDFKYCYHHKGLEMGEAGENNGRAEKHGLGSDPKKYKARQDQEEADWIRSVRESILDRMRAYGREPDFLDEVLAERTAIQLHIVSNATEYVDKNGLVQTVFVEDGGYEKDIPQKLVQELRQYDKDIISNLKKLGVLNDPDSQKADAMERTLAEVLSG